MGVGSIDYPVEYEAADPRMLAQLGVSKVITLTSTYDHRIIQGAESGTFLSRIHRLLLGEDGFYQDVFRSMGVPYEPVQWREDVNPVDQERGHLVKQVHVQTVINMYRVRGHLIADLDPLGARPPRMHQELDPATYGLTLWDLETGKERNLSFYARHGFRETGRLTLTPGTPRVADAPRS